VADELVDEPLYRRVRREEPELDGRIGAEMAGHLMDPDEGGGPDLEKDLVAEEQDDPSSLSPEEAAMHVEEEP